MNDSNQKYHELVDIVYKTPIQNVIKFINKNSVEPYLTIDDELMNSLWSKIMADMSFLSCVQMLT